MLIHFGSDRISYDFSRQMILWSHTFKWQTYMLLLTKELQPNKIVWTSIPCQPKPAVHSSQDNFNQSQNNFIGL